MSNGPIDSSTIEPWLQPLTGDDGPCGSDLEYDNDFLALAQAAAGKPESQFGPAEAPDWRAAFDMAESLLDRSRDLRVAILWLRAALHLHGYSVLPVGLRLVSGLIDTQWEHLHPLPDPDDNDPYARVNALTVLREPEGLIGDLREARVIEDRSIGLLTVRAIEVALGLAPAGTDETEISRGQVSQMMAAAAAKSPDLAAGCLDAAAQTRALIALVNDKLGSGVAPDLRPITVLVNAVSGVLPSAGSPDGDGNADGGADGSAASAGGGAVRQGLSGSVTTREEAIRAIDLVCEFLERSEPTNPAPLFLRRGRQLIGHNFLQLLKALAPHALGGVAEMVGVDPDEVENPGGS